MQCLSLKSQRNSIPQFENQFLLLQGHHNNQIPAESHAILLHPPRSPATFVSIPTEIPNIIFHPMGSVPFPYCPLRAGLYVIRWTVLWFTAASELRDFLIVGSIGIGWFWSYIRCLSFFDCWLGWSKNGSFSNLSSTTACPPSITCIKFQPDWWIF